MAKYNPDVHDQVVYRLRLLQFTDAEIARTLDVTEVTFKRWKNEHASLRQRYLAGGEPADGRVAQAVYERAIGYEHEAVKIAIDARTGAVVTEPYTKHYPPDVSAAQYWLKSRLGGQWADKKQIELTGKDGGPLELSQLPEEEVLRRARERRRQAAG